MERLRRAATAGHAHVPVSYTHLIRGLETNDPELISAAKDRWYVPNPNQAADLEKLREKALLREFQEYRESSQRKLKAFRLEAVKAGFKKAWQDKDYRTIVDVADKLPEQVVQEDPKILMWYNQAVTRVGSCLLYTSRCV